MVEDKCEYALFEVVCYRRLERVIAKREKVLPIVVSWSNWPSHWCAEAALEVRLTDSLMQGSLALLHNKEKSALKSSPKGCTGGEGRGLRRISQSMKVKTTRPAPNTGESNQTNPNYANMLMSIIRYCGQRDTRLAKKILAEFSSSSLFLYCKVCVMLLQPKI